MASRVAVLAIEAIADEAVWRTIVIDHQLTGGAGWRSHAVGPIVARG
jgi:hypothetical protein